MQGESLRWLQQLSADVGAVVTGSMVIRDGDRCYNRLVWMRPDGKFDIYDKRHLFRMAKEHERYGGGDKRLVVEIAGWRVCPMVCYDLRFPVWTRNRYDRSAARFDYDLILYVANWPSARRYAWSTLLRARAMENLSYCVGVNRVGTDGNNLHYAGDSVALDFLGQPLVELGAQEQVVTVTLDPAALAAHRESASRRGWTRGRFRAVLSATVLRRLQAARCRSDFSVAAPRNSRLITNRSAARRVTWLASTAPVTGHKTS